MGGKASDMCEELTGMVRACLESGKLEWQRPWDQSLCGTPSSPFNPVTGTVYKGVNFLRLALDPRTYTTGDPRYVTFANCIKNDWHVRKGQHGIHIVYFEPKDNEEDRPAARLAGGILKTYTVFHASQVDGIPAYEPPSAPPRPLWEKPPEVVGIIARSGINVREVGEQAYYSPATDHIGMPPLGAFPGAAQWSAVLLHEMGHATAHPSRLNRECKGSFGSAEYAEEELRAEFSSLFVCSALGLPTDTQNHSAYIGHWLEKLKNDNKFVITAAREAQKMASYILALREDAQPSPTLSSALERPSEQTAQTLTA